METGSPIMDDMPKMGRARRWAALLVLLFAQFVLSFDLTILNIALPELSAEIRPTSDQQLWIVDIYSLVLAGCLVSASSLSDRWGRKRMFLTGALLFAVASAGIVWANAPEAVIAIRALLGLSAALVMPTTMSMIRNIFTIPKERAAAMAAWSIIGGLGMALGPIIGGALLELFSWHAAFLINVPLMAVAVVAGFFTLPEIRLKNPGRWDVAAALESLVGMALVMWAVKRIAAVLEISVVPLAALVVGVVCLVMFVVRCAKAESPLLDVKLFRNKAFSAGIIAALGSMFAAAALLFLLAQWLQLVDGCSPMESGVKLLPLAVGSLVSGALAPAAAIRFGTRKVLVAGLGIAAFAMLMLLPFGRDLTYIPVAVASGLVGVGSGVLAVGSSVIMCATPPEKASSAAAFEEIAYDLGNVLGVAILGSAASIVYRMGFDVPALLEAGLDAGAVDAAMQSFGACTSIAADTGVTALLTQGMASFTDSIVLTSAIGGVIMIAVTIIVFKLVPKHFDITEDSYE